jgi:hypothetical protein
MILDGPRRPHHNGLALQGLENGPETPFFKVFLQKVEED